MRRYQGRSRRRGGLSVIPAVIYLVGFLLLVGLISHFYLIPALEVFSHADPQGRKLMSADAMLILTLVLVLLLVGLVIIFRVGRFFRLKNHTPAKPTTYVDAWKESANRMKTPGDEDDTRKAGQEY